MATQEESSRPEEDWQDDTEKFNPIYRENAEPDITLSNEACITILQSSCTFPPDIFLGVMTNLVKNPNITSSHLFRADIFYDSGEHNDPLLGCSKAHVQDLKKYLKLEYQPIEIELPQWTRTRTIVRQLIPRNPQLDKPLLQTCHFFHRVEEDSEKTLVLYIPHISSPSDMPFYHPPVANLTFLHTSPLSSSSSSSPSPPSKISLTYTLFPSTPTLTSKLTRTALRLLTTIHKHGQGQLHGYRKRVHHDLIIPQKRYQDTYSRLKAKYGRKLAEQWVEVTDPGKHVFEDIGIAAFLVEVWGEMYGLDGDGKGKAPFPGFVDIGCGNGLLVYILLAEGYEGWGFDARQRKTWSIFPEHVQEKLQQRVLVPELYQHHDPVTTRNEDENPLWHNGIFAPSSSTSGTSPGATQGPFIISNHADELTLWTPFLAYLNHSSFLAIPCCSHDFSGARFRAPISIKPPLPSPSSLPPSPSPQPGDEEPSPSSTSSNDKISPPVSDTKTTADSTPSPQQPISLPHRSRKSPETGSLARGPTHIAPNIPSKPPSAYSSLCTYLSSMTVHLSPPFQARRIPDEKAGGGEVWVAETETLRIPSTRNVAVLGRHVHLPRLEGGGGAEGAGEGGKGEGRLEEDARRKSHVKDIIEREMNTSIVSVARDWIERVEKLSKKPGSGH